MYTSFFGFEEKPFNITPDPRFFYSNPLYNEVYANLLYAVKERKGFAALTGEVGTGKTTLLRKLMDDLVMTARFVYFYNTNLTFEELLSFVCEELQLPVSRKRGRLGQIRALNEFLLEQQKKGGTGVLVIDEAQNLGRDVLENLRLLSNMETGSEKLLQTVLVGQPELKTKLDQPELRQLRQRIWIYCRLDSLKEREVGPFISYRLKAAGCKRNGLFTPEAIRKIAFHSTGIPRLINVICDNALLIAYGNLQEVVSAEIIEEVAHDLQAGAEPITSDTRKPAVKTERQGHQQADLYSNADNGRHGNSISVAGNKSPDREPLLEMQARSAERERSVDVIPAEETILRKVNNNHDTPIGLSTIKTKILKKIDGLHQVQTIANSLADPYLPTAKGQNKLNKSGLTKKVSNSEASGTVPTQFFDLLNSALAAAMGPMAPLVVRDGLATLGHSFATLPKEKLGKLVELVSSEILDDLLKSGFKERMCTVIGALNSTDATV